MKKIKINFLFIVLLFCYTSSFSQANCDELKQENEYLKSALKISNPIKMVTAEKIDFNLTACNGNKKDQTVELTLTLLNHDVNKDFQFMELSALDVEGNEYKSERISIGASGVRNKIYTDSPIKTKVQFSRIMPGITLFKTIIVRYIGENSRSSDFEFKNIPITWD